MREKCRQCEHCSNQGGFCKLGQFIPCSLSGYKKYFKQATKAINSVHDTKGVEAIKYDEGKLDLLGMLQGFILPLGEVAKVYNYGAKEYGLHNWRGLDEERIQKAAIRHLVAVCCGQPLNKEKSKKDGKEIQLYHAAQLAWNSLVLCYFAIKKTENRKVEFDDLPKL